MSHASVAKKELTNSNSDEELSINSTDYKNTAVVTIGCCVLEDAQSFTADGSDDYTTCRCCNN